MADFTSFTIPPPPEFQQQAYVDSPSWVPLQCAGGGATLTYYQRVYSSGLSLWCYYNGPSINPAPAPGDTTPNWTGAITAHEVIAVITP